jgi:hypothetical protein
MQQKYIKIVSRAKMANQVGALNPHASLKTKYFSMGQIPYKSKVQIANEAGVSARTIRRWQIKYENTLEIERNRDPGSSRPRVSTAAQDELLVNFVNNHPFQSLPRAMHQVNFPGKLYF